MYPFCPPPARELRALWLPWRCNRAPPEFQSSFFLSFLPSPGGAPARKEVHRRAATFFALAHPVEATALKVRALTHHGTQCRAVSHAPLARCNLVLRSEERRVGKERRSRG